MRLSRGLVGLTVAIALSPALLACESDRSRDDDSSDASGEPVQIRRVLEGTPKPLTGASPSVPSSSTLPEDCSAAPKGQPDPTVEAIGCDDDGAVYRMAPADIVGGITSARAESAPQQGPGWVVQIEFNETTARALASLTSSLAQTQQLMAMVVDGEVVTATTTTGPISDGKVQISGDFTQTEARKLANALKP